MSAKQAASAGMKLADQLNGSLPAGSEWDEREAALISLAENQANDIEALESVLARQGALVIGSTGQERLNPAYAELRQQRQALSKILALIKLPDEGIGARSGVSAVKSRAANARWDRVRRESRAS